MNLKKKIDDVKFFFCTYIEHKINAYHIKITKTDKVSSFEMECTVYTIFHLSFVSRRR